MDEHGAPIVVSFRAQGGGSPADFGGGPKSGRFCAWRGASDRRYVTIVYPVDRRGADLGLPDFPAFILLSVVRSGTGRHVIDITVIDSAADRRVALTAGLARGADEWHVHILPEDSRLRAGLVFDLRARHGARQEARCA